MFLICRFFRKIDRSSFNSPFNSARFTTHRIPTIPNKQRIEQFKPNSRTCPVQFGQRSSQVTFDDGNCNYHSSSYYCQSLKTTTTTTTTAKVLISKIFNNLNGGSTKHTSTIASSWATHIFPIKTGLPSGTLVTPGTMYYRLGTSSKFSSNCKIGSGMSSGNKDIPMSYGWLCRGIRIWLPP